MNKIFIILLIFSLFLRQIMILNANNNNDTYINTTNIIYDEKNNIIEFADNSKINIGNTNILVDNGVIDYNKNKIEVYGNFYLYQETNILSGKDLQGDTNLKNFTANQVSFIYDNDLKIDSDKASRSDNEVYFFNNFLTPCELVGYFGCPTWSLRIDKTKYNISDDKFTHYDTFLQVADYKIFYLPYFTHYGSKAPRKRGFLTPTFEYGIAGKSSIYTPYYLPINDSTDVIFKPKFFILDGLNILNQYELNTLLKNKSSGGEFSIEVDNIKYEDKANVNSTVRMNLKQVMNKNQVLSFNGLLTNSVSTTRSKNEEPIKFEDIFLRLDNYNFALENDFLSAEVTTIESFDSTSDSLIPLSPRIIYQNNINLAKNITNINELDFTVVKRNESESDFPSENNSFKINSYLNHSKKIENINIYNKVSFLNSFSNYNFEHNTDLNGNGNFNHLIFSSDLYYNFNNNFIPRVKIIHNEEIQSSDNIINEDSNSLTFNYQNLYSDNRNFGTDNREDTSRIIYGFEANYIINNQKFDLNIGQSYDTKKNNKFANKINQKSHLSDYAIEGKSEFNSFSVNFDTRIEKSSYNKKEMNVEFKIHEPVEITLNYHETQKNAYSENSNDTEYLGITLQRKILDNFIFSYNSNIDLKNNFSSYYDSIGLRLFDDCSELNIQYSNRRYNDDYNTSPEELLSINFSMDYLGFFGYQQSTDLFFQEAGNIDYGT